MVDDPILSKKIIRYEKEPEEANKPDIFSLENLKSGLAGQVGTLVGEFAAAKVTGKPKEFVQHFNEVKDKIEKTEFLPSLNEFVSSVGNTISDVFKHPVEVGKDIVREIVRNPQDLLLGTSRITSGLTKATSPAIGSVGGSAVELGLLEGGRQAFENINKEDPNIAKITKSAFNAIGSGAAIGGLMHIASKPASSLPAATKAGKLSNIYAIPLAAGTVLTVDEMTGQKNVISSVVAGLALTGFFREAPALLEAVKVKPKETLARSAVVSGYLAAGAYIDKKNVWEGLLIGGMLSSLPYLRKGTPEIYGKLGTDPDKMGRAMNAVIDKDVYINEINSRPYANKDINADAETRTVIEGMFKKMMLDKNARSLYRNSIYEVSHLLNKEIEGEVKNPKAGPMVVPKPILDIVNKSNLLSKELSGIKKKKEAVTQWLLDPSSQITPKRKEEWKKKYDALDSEEKTKSKALTTNRRNLSALRMQLRSQFVKPVTETFDQFLEKLEIHGLDTKKNSAILYRALTNAESKATAYDGFISGLKSAGNATESLITAGQQDFFTVEQNILKKYPHLFTDYVHIDNQLFSGMAVHKDLAPSLKFLFESSRVSDPVRGMLAAAMTAKRLNFLGSLFHGINLTISSIMMTGILDLKNKKIINPLDTVRSGLDVLKNSPLGPEIDLVIRSGVKLDHAPDIDTKMLKKIGDVGDSLLGKLNINSYGALGKSAGFIEHLQAKSFDALTWDYLHKGYKVGNFLKLYSDALIKHPNISHEEIGRQVADVINTSFGGLNWFDIATQTDSYLTRRMAMVSLNPHARKILQIALQAPDWTIATSLGVIRGLPYNKASGDIAKGIYKNILLRNLLFHFTVLNGVNYAFSGHFIWQNEDPTKVDLPDGSKMTINRHGTEFWELMMDPTKIMTGKISTLVKQTVEQVSGREWIGGPKIKNGVIQHLLHGLLPIPGSEFFKEASEKHYGEALFKTLLSVGGVTFSGHKFKEKETYETRKRAEERRNRKGTVK